MDMLHIKALLAVCAHVSVMIEEPETALSFEYFWEQPEGAE